MKLTALRAEAILVSVMVVFFNVTSWFAFSRPLAFAASVLGLVFLPGYVLTTLAFPATESRSQNDGIDSPLRGETRQYPGLSPFERLVASVGLSVAIAGLLGLLLGDVGLGEPFGYGRQTVQSAVTLVTVVLFVAGLVRRTRVPESERFVGFTPSITEFLSNLDGETRLDTTLNVAVVAALLYATATVGFVVAAPQDGSDFTSVSLLTENETGSLVAGGYDTTLEPGNSTDLVLAVENHEGQSVDYSVLVVLQRVDENGTVVEATRMNRFDSQVAAGERWTRAHTVTPPLRGDRLRLAYLVYRGDPPADPTTQNAYRYTTLWMRVGDTAPAGGTAGEGGGDAAVEAPPVTEESVAPSTDGSRSVA